MRQSLYLDCAATAPPYESVIDAVAHTMRQVYGNASSLHRLGVEAEQLVNQARAAIAAPMQISPAEIIFTSGGTESNNLAIKGAALQYRKRGNHLITSLIEHPSVIEPFRQLEKEGFRVTYLPVDATGQIQIDAMEKAVTDETILVSIMAVNNEIGRIQPIAEACKRVKAVNPRTIFHVDAAQAIGNLRVMPAASGVDMLSVSAHKFGGPKGAGFLYRRKGIELHPLHAGGGQEYGVRSGTENVPLIVGMAKALKQTNEDIDNKIAHKYALRQIIVDAVRQIDELQLTGSSDPQAMSPHIVHFCFPGMKSEVVLHALEMNNIYISSKSACSSGASKPSDVLLAMGASSEMASSGLRISFADYHTEEDMRHFAAILRQVVTELMPMRQLRRR